MHTDVKAPKMSELVWHVTPREQGQIVQVGYAADVERCGYWRHTQDRSDGSVVFEWLPFGDATGGVFEPWNGRVPEGPWLRLWPCDGCKVVTICNVAPDGDTILCRKCDDKTLAGS